MKNKFRAFALSLLILLGSSPAQAIFPVVALVMWASGGSTTMATSVLISTLTVGSVVAFVGFKTQDANTPALTVQLAPGASVDTPSGWTQGATGADPIPPASAPSTGGYGASSSNLPEASGGGASQSEALSAFLASANIFSTSGAPHSACSSTTSGFTWINRFMTCDNAMNGIFQVTAGTNCSPGYTYSGTACILTSPPSSVPYPPDTKCQIKRTAGGFSKDPRDPDCTGLDPSVTISGNEVQVVSADGSHVSIKYDATTGVTSAIESTPISGSPGVNNRRQVQFSSPIASTDSSVMVTGVAQITGTGSGTLSGGVTPSGTGSASTDAKLDQIKAGQCGGPGQPKCNMQIDETGTPTDGYLTAQKSDFSAAVNTTVGTINNLAGEGVRSSIGIGFNPIFFDAPCEDPTFAIPGGRGNLIVPMCDKKGAVSKIMDFLMWAFTAFYLWGLAVSSFKK